MKEKFVWMVIKHVTLTKENVQDVRTEYAELEHRIFYLYLFN
jgi:hypothetical protein